MKKYSVICLILLVMLFSCACSGDNTNSGSDLIVDTNINYSKQDMGNYMNYCPYNVYDGWIYMMNFPEEGGRALLSKMRMDGDDYSVLTSKGVPFYVNVDGEYVYAILQSEGESKVYRCRLGGNDLTCLSKDNIWGLQLVDSYLYYNKYDISNGKSLGYYRCNKDGSNEELVYDKEIYYSYIIGDKLYYQDDNDGETVHVYNLETKEDKQITKVHSYGFIVDSEYIYYIGNDKSVQEGDYKGYLAKQNLNTGKETVLYDGTSTADIILNENTIYFVNDNDERRIYSIGTDGTGIKLVTQDTNCERLAIYGDHLIYTDFDSDYEYIDAIYICGLDGSNKINLSVTE